MLCVLRQSLVVMGRSSMRRKHALSSIPKSQFGSAFIAGLLQWPCDCASQAALIRDPPGERVHH